MDTQRTLLKPKVTNRAQKRVGWPVLHYWLPHILALTIAVWPVVLDTYTPGHFVECQKFCRAVHRHYKQKSVIDAAMQSACNGMVQIAIFGSTHIEHGIKSAKHDKL